MLAELGPGRGTLMRDALRAGAAMPGFRDAARLWLVETSPALRARQAEVLGGGGAGWAGRVEELPAGPLFVVANEFFDALPIRQVQRTDALWRERQVGLAGGGLRLEWASPRPDAVLEARFPRLPDGAVAELNLAGEAIAARARRADRGAKAARR